MTRTDVIDKLRGLADRIESEPELTADEIADELNQITLDIEIEGIQD